MQFAQGGDVLVDVECEHERTIFEKPEQCIMRPGETREQMHCLGQHRLTYEKGRFQVLDPLSDPAVMLFRTVKKSD